MKAKNLKNDFFILPLPLIKRFKKYFSPYTFVLNFLYSHYEANQEPQLENLPDRKTKTIAEQLLKDSPEIASEPEVLKTLLSHHFNYQQLINNLKTALYYPLLLFILSILVGIFISYQILVKFKYQFASVGNWIEKEFALIPDFLKSPLAIVLFIIVIIILLKYLFSKKIDKKILLSLPLFNKIFILLKYNLYLKLIKELLKQNKTLVDIFKLLVNLEDNPLIKKDLNIIYSNLKNGNSFQNSINLSKYMPKLIKNSLLLASNEDELSETIEEVSQFVDEEIDESIEPLIMIVHTLATVAVSIFIIFNALVIFSIVNIQPPF